MFQGCFKKVSKKFQGSFKSVSREFKGISHKFQVCFKEEWTVGSLQWVARVFERISKEISEKFQMCCQGISRKSQGCFKKSFKVLQGSLKGVLRKFQYSNFKEDWRVFQVLCEFYGSFKGISRKIVGRS